MKTLYKHSILILCLFLSTGLSSCLEEKDDLYEVVGAVATIPVFTASKAQPLPGETITLSLRYFSPNVAVKELQLNETIGTGSKTLVTSKEITGFDTQNSYVDTFTYTVPAGLSKTSIVLEAAAIGTNDLAGTRTVTLTIQ